jgi:hypothetical protein
MSDIINTKSQQIGFVSKNQSNIDHEDLVTKKLPLSSTIINNDDRTVLAHHIFHANIKQTFIRWIRETPV